MNAVVYARYSSHKQGEQSIEGQLASAYKYAGEHGYTIIHEYIDRTQTGRNDDREQFQQMLKDTSLRQSSSGKSTALGATGKKLPLTNTDVRRTALRCSTQRKAFRIPQRALFWRLSWREWRNTIPYSWPPM